MIIDDCWTFVIRVPKPRRTWFQMRSRTLLLLTLLTAVLLATFASDDRRSTYSALFGGVSLSQQHLDVIEMAWARAGLNEWKRHGTRLYVPDAVRDDYLAALKQYAFPNPTLNSQCWSRQPIGN